MNIKTLYLARHAKSSWKSNLANDFDRPLSKRGENDAKRVGAEIQTLDWRPEKMISSPAIRAKQTCKTYCDALSFPIDSVVWNADIYNAFNITLLHLLAAQSEDTRSVMLIGHNPAMEDLLLHLCGYSTVQTCQQADGKILTTANIAKLELDTSWENLVMEDARLSRLLRPKELA